MKKHMLILNKISSHLYEKKFSQSMLIIFLIMANLSFFSSNSLASIAIQHWTTKQGAEVYFVPTNQLPIVDIHVIFDAGSSRDEGHPGLAYLVNNMLANGTWSHDANTIAEIFESKGIHYQAWIEKDKAYVTLRTLNTFENLKTAIDLLNDLLTGANFPEVALNRVKKQTIQMLKSQQQDPGFIAKQAFFAKLYPNHPYGHSKFGTKTTLDTITPPQLLAFYQYYYCAKNAKLIIVGALTKPKASAISQRIFHNMLSGQPAKQTPDAPALSQAYTQTITFPSEQTHLILGQIGISRSSKHYFPLLVGNFILGQSPLTSRLFHEIRDKYGLVYSIYSFFDRLQAKGPFMIQLQTRKDKAKQSIDKTQAVLRNFVTHGPNQQEILHAKQHIRGQFLIDLASNSAMADQVGLIAFYHLPLNYLTTFASHIEAVTKEEIKKAFQDTIHPNQLLMIRVGNHDSLSP